MLLESAGRPDATASNDPRGAVGLTQILAETGQNLLKMRVDPARSRRPDAADRAAPSAGARPSAWPSACARSAAASTSATTRPRRWPPPARYLTFAKRPARPRRPRGRQLPHGRRQPAERASTAFGGGEDTPVRRALLRLEPAAARQGVGHARRRSATTPRRTCGASRRRRTSCAATATTPARSSGARRAMTAKNSAEEVLHPRGRRPRSSPSPRRSRPRCDSRRPARRCAARELRAEGIRIDPQHGRAGAAPEAAQVALPRRCSPTRSRCSSTSPAARRRSARPSRSCSRARCATSATSALLTRRNIEATHGYSLHTTGWAFDIERTYRSRAPGARVPVHARPPAGAEPHRLGARARRDPRHGGPGGRASCATCSSQRGLDLLGDVRRW